jgi:glycosyltransferase involved in cell wall biosynthesis
VSVSENESGQPKGRLAFVTPRYGVDVVGGSEAVMREAAHGLAARGWQSEILTTCARDHYTWKNEYPVGATTDGAVTVRRFEVEPGTAARSRALMEERISAFDPLTPDEQLRWLDTLFRVPDLFQHLVVNADGYDAIILSPYLFWTTVTGAMVKPERTIVMPCLHDEGYARIPLLHTVLRDPAMLWFLSEPEQELARSITDIAAKYAITGAGVNVPAGYDVEGFKRRHGITRPYVLFAGRREGGKGWTDLLDDYRFTIAKYDIPIDLLTIGVGPVAIPGDLTERVTDLGFLEEDEVANAFAGASAYVQPSTNESFSRTVMEAWLANTPVIATAHSEVLAWHCNRSGGGLLYADRYELAQCLAFVTAEPAAAATLAEHGRKYVLENYQWHVVIDKMEASLQDLLCAPSS